MCGKVPTSLVRGRGVLGPRFPTLGARPIAGAMGGVRAITGVCNGLSLAVIPSSFLPPFICALFLFLLGVDYSSIKITQQKAAHGFLFGLAKGRYVCLNSAPC